MQTLTDHIKTRLTELLQQINQNVSGYISIHNDVVKEVDVQSDSSHCFREMSVDPLSDFAELVLNPDNKPTDYYKIFRDTEQTRQKLWESVMLPNLKFLTPKQLTVISLKMLGLSERTIAQCMDFKNRTSVRTHIYGARNQGGALRTIIKHWLKTIQNTPPEKPTLRRKLNLNKKVLYTVSTLFFPSPYSKTPNPIP